VVAPVTPNVLDKVVAPVVDKVPPIYTFLAIPTPPAIITAPVVVLEESVVLENVLISVVVKVEFKVISPPEGVILKSPRLETTKSV
jgi:hypothetical protein